MGCICLTHLPTLQLRHVANGSVNSCVSPHVTFVILMCFVLVMFFILLGCLRYTCVNDVTRVNLLRSHDVTLMGNVSYVLP